MRNRTLNRAFTLAELIAVMVIIAVIAAIAYPRYMVTVEKMRAKEAEQNLTALLSAQKRKSCLFFKLFGTETGMNSVIYEREGPIAWIILNDPDRLNALTEEMGIAIIKLVGASNQ